MTNLTARPGAGPRRCPQPPPRITTAKTPAPLAAASSASTRSSRNAATSGYGRAGGTIAGRSDRAHRDPRDPRPRDREGSPRPGRPQAGSPRQRDRDIRDRRFPEATAPTTAMVIRNGLHVAFWLADANHPAHTSAPVRTRTYATRNKRTLGFSSVQRRIQAAPARSS